MTNLETVQQIYQAFGRGDAGAIVERCAEDIDWEHGAVPNGVPWLRHGRGRAQVMAFLQTAATELEFRSFTVVELVGNDRVVIAICSLEALVKKNGRTIVESCEPHVWHFDDKGRVIRFRHAADTYGQAQAWNG